MRRMSIVFQRLVRRWRRLERKATLDALERELNVLMVQALRDEDWATHNLAGKMKEYDLHDLREFQANSLDMTAKVANVNTSPE